MQSRGITTSGKIYTCQESSPGIEAMLLCFTTCSLFTKHTVLSRLPLLAIEAMLLCFTTCSLFTKHTVLSRLPLLALSWFIQRQRCCVVLHTVECCTVWRIQICFKMRKNWSCKAQANLQSSYHAAGIHSYCCVIRFPVCYFWLAFCDPYRCL